MSSTGKEDAAAAASTPTRASAVEEMQKYVSSHLDAEARWAKAAGIKAFFENTSVLDKVGALEVLEEFERNVDVVVAGLSATAALQVEGCPAMTEPRVRFYVASPPGDLSTKKAEEEEQARSSLLEHLHLEEQHLRLKEREYRCLLYARNGNGALAEASLNAAMALKELATSLERIPPRCSTAEWNILPFGCKWLNEINRFEFQTTFINGNS